MDRVISYSLFWGAARGCGYRGRRHRRTDYAFGLWHAVGVASRSGWSVRVYHDGSVENILRRFRAAFPPPALQCVRVRLAPDLTGRRYIGCLFRMLAADDPNVDVWISRDLDDRLDPMGLTVISQRWLADRPDSRMHWQAERYDTPTRQSMVNLGWYGQHNNNECMVGTVGRPSMAVTLCNYLRSRPIDETDRYTADEEFLTDEWIPMMRRTGNVGRITRIPSHPYRTAVPAIGRRPKAWRRFWLGRIASTTAHTTNDPVVDMY